jgi:hypothetical protein
MPFSSQAADLPPGPPLNSRGDAGYYDNRQQYADPPQQPQQAYNQQAYNNEYQGQEPKYTQQPPNYGQNYNAPPPQIAEMGGKKSFDQTLKIQKPKWNDLWAGILVPRIN